MHLSEAIDLTAKSGQELLAQATGDELLLALEWV